MAKIAWDDKVTFLPQPVPEVNKFTADNANEAKDSVNDLYDIVDGLIDDVAAILIDITALEERSNQAQAQAMATAAVATDVSATRVPAERGIWWFWAHIKTIAINFVGKLTLDVNPRLSGTTASQFLRVDANKDLESVAAATQAEMITGTDNLKPATSLSTESKRSIKSVPVSNAATGSTNLDCTSSQEKKFVYNTTVTGNITITKSNDSNLEIYYVAIPITGSNIQITFPADTRMDRMFEVAAGLGWYESTKILMVSAGGTADLFEFSLMRIGSIFELRYGGPSRA